MLAPVKFDGEMVDLVASPIRLSDTPVVAPTEIPTLGAHTNIMMAEVLGYSVGKIAELRAAGAFGKEKV